MSCICCTKVVYSIVVHTWSNQQLRMRLSYVDHHERSLLLPPPPWLFMCRYLFRLFLIAFITNWCNPNCHITIDFPRDLLNMDHSLWKVRKRNNERHPSRCLKTAMNRIHPLPSCPWPICIYERYPQGFQYTQMLLQRLLREQLKKEEISKTIQGTFHQRRLKWHDCRGLFSITSRPRWP